MVWNNYDNSPHNVVDIVMSTDDIVTVTFSSITEDVVVSLLVFDFVARRGRLGFHGQLSKVGSLKC